MAQVQEETSLPVLEKDTKTYAIHAPSLSQDSEGFEDAQDTIRIKTGPLDDSKINENILSDEETTRIDSVEGVADDGGRGVVETVTVETVAIETIAAEQLTPGTVESEQSTDELSSDEENVSRRRRRASSVESQTSEQSDTEEDCVVQPEIPIQEQTTEEVTTEEQASEEHATEELPTEELTTEEHATEERTAEELPTGEVATEELPTGEVATEELTTEELPTVEQPKDPSEDVQNPMYVPTKGRFFQHDHRLGDDEQPEPTPEEHLSRVDRIETWTHDLYIESQQGPRTREEKEKDARYWSNRESGGGMRFRGDVRFGKRYEDRQHTDRPGRSRDQGERSHDQDGRSRDQGGRSRGQDGRSHDQGGRSRDQDGRSHDQGGRSHDQDGRSRDHDERSEGRSRDRDRRLGGRSQAQHEQPNRRRPYNEGSGGGERNRPVVAADRSPVEEWPSLGGPATHTTRPHWPLAPNPPQTVDVTTRDKASTEPPQQNLTTLTSQQNKNKSSDKNSKLEIKNDSPGDMKSGVDSAQSKTTPPRNKSLFNVSRQTGESGESGDSMTYSLSKGRELVVRKGRGRGRGTARGHTPQERRVGRRPNGTMTVDAHERNDPSLVTKNSQNPPATQDQESTSTDQAALTNPTSRVSLETSRVSLETNRVSLETNREELAADGGSKQQEETLPQFPAGVGRPKRYSTRRQKTEDAAAAADQSSGSLTTTPSVQPSTDGLLPTPSHPSHPTHPTQFDSEAHMKMFQMQQDMMAANPELLNYQAALMAQQNPMIMQYLWLQQQQALQQSMLHGGLPAIHQLHDRPTQPSGGEIPHQQMGMVGADGFYHSTPDGLFVPNLQHVVAQQSPRQQSGGKPRSQAIPIIPPKDEP